MNSTVSSAGLVKAKLINSDDFLLDLYIKSLRQRKVSVLKKEEELELVEKIRNGDHEARTKFIESNLRLVVSVAKKFRHHGCPFIDLINVGNIALIKSLESFNPLESKFSTYATFLIEKFIFRHIQKHSRTVHLPEERYKDWGNYQKIVEFLTSENITPPSDNEIDSLLGKDPGWTTDLKNLFSDVMSLNCSTCENSDVTFMDSLIDTTWSYSEPEVVTEQAEYKVVITKLLDVLDAKSSEVIKMYYGIECRKEYSQNEIADHLNVSQQRVFQIKSEGLRKMLEKAEVLKIDIKF